MIPTILMIWNIRLSRDPWSFRAPMRRRFWRLHFSALVENGGGGVGREEYVSVHDTASLALMRLNVVIQGLNSIGMQASAKRAA